MSPIRRVARAEGHLVPHRWAWAEGNADLIANHWARRRAAQPALFNGRVLMVADVVDDGDVVTARFFVTDYANLLAWIEHDFQGEPVWNGFAMGALRGCDGGFVLGRMAAHTANAGRLYFPCGTPDLSDVTASGEVDLAASLTREIGEETGLSNADYTIEPGWVVVTDRGLMAFMRTVRMHATAAETCSRITAHIAADAKPELASAEIVSSVDALDDPSMPSVVPLFLRDAFEGTARPQAG